jgi:transcriptional regulator with GAF, ATPase, and Fis domain
MTDKPNPMTMPHEHWYRDALIKALLDEQGAGVFLVKGPSSAQAERDLTPLGVELAATGRLCFALVGDRRVGDGRGPFFEILHRYVEEVETRGRLSDEARRLFEFLSTSLESLGPGGAQQWSRLSQDGAGRLWAELSRCVPAVLFVLYPGRLDSTESERLSYLLRYFYADPIAALEPELFSWERAQGSVVFFEPGFVDAFEPKIIDLQAPALDSVRAFLANDDVVQRFFASTGGDLRQLDELIETLPQGLEQFWMHRYARLDEELRQCVDVLAAAGQPLTVDGLHKTLELLGWSRQFSRTIKELVAQGYVRRKVARATVMLELDNGDLGLAVVATLGAGRLQAIHRALAEGELATQGVNASRAFLARHFIAANEVEQGLQHGLDAVAHLMQRRSYEPARELLDELLALASSHEALRAIHDHLAMVHTQLGDPRQALRHCGHLKRFIEDAMERVTLNERMAQLLVSLGEGESALRLLEEASQWMEGVGVESLKAAELALGRGEACYGLGRHDEAQSWARVSLDGFEAEAGRAGIDMARTDEGLIRARNLLGKVAIFKVRYEEAVSLFEANNQLAATWGWDKERGRAQANIGVVALQRRQYDEALRRLTEALELSKIPGSLPRAYCLLNLGNVFQRQAQYGKALDHFLEALRASRQSGDVAAYHLCAHNLATLYQDMGAFDRARGVIEHLEDAAGGRRANFVGRWTKVLKAHVLLDEDRFAEALSQFESLRQEDSDLRNIVYGAEAALREAEAHLGLGQWKAAYRIVEELVLPDDGGHEPQLEALQRSLRARIALERNDFEAAEATARQAVAELERLGNRRDALQALLVQGQALAALERRAEASGLLEAALQSLHDRAQTVPDKLQGGFYRIGLHQRLVEQVRALSGQIPGGFSLEADEVPQQQEPVAPQRGHARDAAFIKWRSRFVDIIGEDPRLHQAFRFVDRVASSDTTVLILGESGTGKELIAEAIHRESNRKGKPFVKVNCAAFVESLLLSELFGHEKGAFTGALSQKPGRFELADGGTLFLDEIGDISPNTQVALLRVLQEGTFERVGGAETKTVDVRIVCATNKNLEEMVKRGEFRLDLYYRLKGLVVELPALRERRQDIPLLLHHFAERYASGESPRRFSLEAMHFLSAYSWAGNVRELENFVKSVLLFVEGDVVEMHHIEEFSEFFADGHVDLDLPALDYANILPMASVEEVAPTEIGTMRSPAVIAGMDDPEEALIEQIVAEGISLTKLKKRLELECIKRALLETDGNITRAAELLQMKRPRLSQIINASPELLHCKDKLVG